MDQNIEETYGIRYYYKKNWKLKIG